MKKIILLLGIMFVSVMAMAQYPVTVSTLYVTDSIAMDTNRVTQLGEATDDYDAVPFWQIQDSIAIAISNSNNIYEKELANAEVAISVGFNITSTSIVFLNGGVIKSSQWGGVGTETLTLILDTKQYDNFLIRQ